MRTKGSHLSGSAASGKISSTGHSGSQAPQSMHSSGSMTRILSASWMQSTGQTSTQERSLMSIQIDREAVERGEARLAIAANRLRAAVGYPAALDGRHSTLRHNAGDASAESARKQLLIPVVRAGGVENGDA